MIFFNFNFVYLVQKNINNVQTKIEEIVFPIINSSFN